MFALIVLVIIGLGMAFFSTQNLTGIPITLANYTWTGVPLYLVVIGSLLLGIIVSWLISLVDMFSSMVTIQGKNAALKDALRKIEILKKEKYTLEIENAHLKGNSKVIVKEEKREVDPSFRPSFFHRIKHSV